ncbi:hypothetical protein [Phascolarctobacterium faecium]|jgi:hypothetical protein
MLNKRIQEHRIEKDLIQKQSTTNSSDNINHDFTDICNPSNFHVLLNRTADVMTFPKQVIDFFSNIDFNPTYAKVSSNGHYYIFVNPTECCLLNWKSQIIIKHIKVTKMADCWVTDNGTFLLEDCSTSAKGGKLIVLNHEGYCILSRSFSAHIFNTSLSPDGRYAAVQLCNSSTTHANKLFVYDLHTKKRFTINKGYLTSNQYSFFQDNILLSDSDGECIYNITSGQFLKEV